jgi:tRNA(fMet)-specific endonuclease VapC
MVILDTDHMTLLERKGSDAGKDLEERLLQLSEEEVATTVVSCEEQFRGWMTALSKSKRVADQVERYRRLKLQLEIYCAMTVLDFDQRAAIEFQRLRKEHRRLAAMDLKIAAIALSSRATLLSRNLRDFSQISGLDVQDWTQ